TTAWSACRAASRWRSRPRIRWRAPASPSAPPRPAPPPSPRSGASSPPATATSPWRTAPPAVSPTSTASPPPTAPPSSSGPPTAATTSSGSSGRRPADGRSGPRVQDELAGGAAGAQGLVGAGGLGERVDRADLRGELALGREGEQLPQRLPVHAGAAEAVHQPEADDRAGAAHQLRGLDRRRGRTGGEAVGDQAAEGRQRGERGVEDRAAGHLQDDVDLAAAVGLHEAVLEAVRVGGDGGVGAQ